jgi:hypothetical protein
MRVHKEISYIRVKKESGFKGTGFGLRKGNGSRFKVQGTRQK